MTATLEGALRRDRTIVAAALAIVTALAWVYLLRLNATMPAMSSMPAMPGMPGMNMGPAPDPFAPVELAFTAAMWVAMMIGMMTPSAAPMILLYARVGGQARAAGKAFAPTGWFAGGYLLAWSGFAIAASIAQAALAKAALITPMLAAANNVFAGVLFLAAGLYQWTPLKDNCLAHCQAPLAFLLHRGGFKRDIRGSFALGLTHGLYCIGCCWALMALLFVGGVMNILWIALLSIFVLVEKLVSSGRWITRSAGLVLMAAGAIYLYRTAI